MTESAPAAVMSAESGERVKPATADETGWDALLADGDVARIRPVTTSDAAALRRLHDIASDRSIYLRFFSLNRHAGEQYVTRLLRADGQERLALIAEEHGGAIGMAGCERVPGTADAEVAFLVADQHQHRGVGTLLLEHLAAEARHHGIRRFVAETMTDNHQMLKVFADAGFPVTRRSDQDVTSITIPLAPTPELQLAVDARERAADIQSLRHLLTPGAVAVVGASDRPGSVGGALLHSIISGGFAGPVYPVNKRRPRVGGLPAYPSLSATPTPVDLAVVAVPRHAVFGVIADCAARGVPAAVIVTAGFGESGEDGAQLERELLRLARSSGVRLIGPNCLGVACTDPKIRLNATFSATPPVPGPIALASQSGALGIALLHETAQRGLGISSFVSLGNKIDVSSNDLLLYWENDPRTRVVALYLESFGNPRKFLRHAARVARQKPVVALKAGRTAAGARAGASHTAATATPDVIVTALLRQAGVIHVRTSAELLDVAQLLGVQPIPAGTRLGVIGNSGGPGILAADAAEDCGLAVPEFSAATQDALRQAAPRLTSASNPIDLGAAAGPDAFESALGVLLGSDEIDAAVVIYASPLVSEPFAVATAMRRVAAATPHRTVAVALLGTEDTAALTDPKPPLPPLPAYQFAESAVRALGHAAQHASWLRRPRGSTRHPAGFDADAVRAVAVQTLKRHPEGGWLDVIDAYRLAAATGIPQCPTEPASSIPEAVAAAERIGYPVALKTAAAVHKTDVGGVVLGLRNADELRSAFPAVAAAGGHPEAGVVVQPMVRPGVELLIGVTRVEPYPPLVLVGLGGTATELLADTAVRLAPLTDIDAREAVRELRAAPLLLGYRGQPPTDVSAVEELLLRVSALADEVPELTELDLNPVVVSPEGVVAVDIKARLSQLASADDMLSDPLVRRLR